MAGALPQRIVIEEWDCRSSKHQFKTKTITSHSLSPPTFQIHRSDNRLNELWQRALGAFVPEDFPRSVTSDYVSFQFWDTLQGLSTYIRTMLSTQALLLAIGVGEKSATVIGATFMWFLRDFTGMFGGILFTLHQGSDFDSNAKMWRLTADLMNNLGMLMDLLSPLFPSAFMFIVCLGSLLKSLTGVASGATRAALTQHFALQNNAADIAAKEGSQETMATLIGMAIGMLLAHSTQGHSLSIWIFFFLLSLFHMYANYKAVGCLCLTTLNGERSSILLCHFILMGEVLSLKQVSRMEHFLPPLASLLMPNNNGVPLYRRIRFGVKLSSLENYDMMEILRLAAAHYKKEKYILVERKGIINVVVHKDSTAPDLVKAYFQALVMGSSRDNNNVRSPHTESGVWMSEHYNNLLAKLRVMGWKTDRILLPSTVWKANWEFETSQKTD